jgi:molecular chaperone DnaK
MPQVEVSFDIDANGILHVSAKDKKTGKEQKVEIKAGSGLSDEEIQRMVQDAESHREEDKKFHELVQARNHADALIHATRTAIKDNGDKVGGDLIGRAEGAIAELETAMKGDDKGQIEAKTNALQQAAQSLYAAASAGHGGDSGAGPEAGGNAGAQAEDVVDAEFTEVKDDNQK